MTIAAKIDRQVINRLDKCKVIGRYGVGLDNIDVDAATEKGIVVTYVPVYCQEEVALLAVTLMLACERRVMIADRVVKSGNWKGAVAAVNGARSPRGKTFGLVGFGSIARQVVPFVKPLGLRVIAYDPYINLEYCKELDVESVELPELLRTSDYISLHVPLLPSTHHMIAAKELSMMKKDAILINTGRGALIDQKSLFVALRDKRIAAAGLDVLEVEPPDPKDPIFSLDNIITSGHIGAATSEALVRLRENVAQGVADTLAGKWPKVLGNPDIKKKLTLRD